jgi:hypothetical protein
MHPNHSNKLPLRNSSVKTGFKARQELKFSDVVDVTAHQVLSLAAVCHLQWGETTHIKWL